MAAHEIANAEKLAALVLEARSAMEAGTGGHPLFLSDGCTKWAQRCMVRDKSIDGCIGNSCTTRVVPRLILRDGEGDEAVCPFPQKGIEYGDVDIELLSAQKTTRAYALAVDNTAAARTLKKGHSCSAGGDQILCEWIRRAPLPCNIIIVPTACQRADFCSRGIPQVPHDVHISIHLLSADGENNNKAQKL